MISLDYKFNTNFQRKRWKQCQLWLLFFTNVCFCFVIVRFRRLAQLCTPKAATKIWRVKFSCFRKLFNFPCVNDLINMYLLKRRVVTFLRDASSLALILLHSL